MTYLRRFSFPLAWFPFAPISHRSKSLSLLGISEIYIHKMAEECSTSSANVEGSYALREFFKNMLAGGLAGTSVDVALFPIDTVKTRLQSPVGFWKSGGFSGIYRGIGAAAAGSAPGASLFFCTYEGMKPIVGQKYKALGIQGDAPVHMTAACMGEVMACLVRVPTEVLKSRMQTNQPGTETLKSTFRIVISEKGTMPVFGGLYKGYGITIMREIPFALIQFPLYEWGKKQWAKSEEVDQISPLKAASVGSITGGIAAAFTTPLDVVRSKTIISYVSFFNIIMKTDI